MIDGKLDWWRGRLFSNPATENILQRNSDWPFHEKWEQSNLAGRASLLAELETWLYLLKKGFQVSHLPETGALEVDFEINSGEFYVEVACLMEHPEETSLSQFFQKIAGELEPYAAENNLYIAIMDIDMLKPFTQPSASVKQIVSALISKISSEEDLSQDLDFFCDDIGREIGLHILKNPVEAGADYCMRPFGEKYSKIEGPGSSCERVISVIERKQNQLSSRKPVILFLRSIGSYFTQHTANHAAMRMKGGNGLWKKLPNLAGFLLREARFEPCYWWEPNPTHDFGADVPWSRLLP
jgi:hypothetical protein